MSLNWDISKVENHDELFVEGTEGERVLDGVTNAFIWMALATGLGKNWSLDEAFAPEFYARIKLLEKLNGPLLRKDGESYFITPEDVRRRIGLGTNVSPVTRAAFIKNLVTSDLDADGRRYKAAQKEAVNA